MWRMVEQSRRMAEEVLHLRAIQGFVWGDRQSDIMAGVNAGAKTVLVKTANTPVTSAEATYTAPNLLDAATYIIANSR